MSDVDRLIAAINDLEEQTAQLTAAVEYAAGRVEPSEETDDPQPSEDSEVAATPAESDKGTKSERFAQMDTVSMVKGWLEEHEFDVENIDVYNHNGNVEIRQAKDFERTERWDLFTEKWFKEGPGDVHWQRIDPEDESKGWYPPTFQLPHEKLEEVVG